MHVSSQSTVLAPARLRGGFGAYRGTTGGTRRHQLPRPPRPRTAPPATTAAGDAVTSGDAAILPPGETATTAVAGGTSTTATGPDTAAGTDAGWCVHPFVD